MKKIYTFLFCLLSGIISMYAQSFDNEGVYYEVISNKEKTCTVVYNESYSGEIHIPSQTEYNGELYNVIEIQDDAFNYRPVTLVEIPEGVITLGARVFIDCPYLTQVFLPQTLKSIGIYCFWNCPALTTIDIPSGVESIGLAAFRNCEAMESFFWPESCEEMPMFCFAECKRLHYVEIPEGLKRIQYQAMSLFVFLEELTLPSTLEMIGANAFEGMVSLKTLTVNAVVPPIAEYSFFANSDIFDTCTVIVPDESVEAYKTTAPWNQFKNIYSSSEVKAVSSTHNFNLTNKTLSAGNEAVEIFSLDGKSIAKVNPFAKFIFPQTGCYVVNTPTCSKKVIIK